MSTRWRLMAHMAVNAKVNGDEHQEVTFANYLQQAYESGKEDGFKMMWDGGPVGARTEVDRSVTTDGMHTKSESLDAARPTICLRT